MSQANKNPICLCGSLHCTTWPCHWSRFGCSWTTYCMLIIVYQTDKRLAESDLCHETNTKQSPLFVFSRKHPSSVGSGYTRLYWRWCQLDDDIIYEKHSTLLALCEGIPPVFGWFPSQRPVMWRVGGVFLLSGWTSCWTNSGVARDFRCNGVYVGVMAFEPGAVAWQIPILFKWQSVWVTKCPQPMSSWMNEHILTQYVVLNLFLLQTDDGFYVLHGLMWLLVCNCHINRMDVPWCLNSLDVSIYQWVGARKT